MDEKDRLIQRLTRDVERWKGLALAAANRACVECERLDIDCDKCRMKKTKEEAAKK